MMYSQQEYDMVRRQTMQIEADKRALLRYALIAMTALFALALVLTAWMYRRYSVAGNLVEAAEAKVQTAETNLQQVSKELAEKKAILERSAGTVAQQNATIQSVVPKLLNKTAVDREIADLAHAIYQQPGHQIALPGIPPDSILRSFRTRVDGKPLKYTLVAGQLDGKWVLYSLLVKNQEDKASK